MQNISIRLIAGRCAALALASLWFPGAATNAAAAQARTLTVATWGGPYERSQEKAYFEPFTRKTGIRIETERYNGGLAELRRQLSSGKVTWDLVDMTMADNRAACNLGLLEPIDHSMLLPAPDGTPGRSGLRPTAH